MESVLCVWRTVDSDANVARSFCEEREVIPGQQKQFVGGYKFGPSTWQWTTFPFKDFGSRFASLLRPSTPDMKFLMKYLSAACPPEVHVGTYTMVHKMRTYMFCEGICGQLASGDWLAGYVLDVYWG